MKYKAIILAAGRGSRLKELTADKPKCLVSLHNKPLLLWQLDAIKGAGISDIGIVLGYKSEKIKPFKLHTFQNHRWNETNMVSTLNCADAWLSEYSCIVSYSDIVYSKRCVTKLIEAPGDITISYDKNWLALWKMRFENPLDDAETFKLNKRGTITEIGNKTDNLDEIEGQYMGLLKFTPLGWGIVKKFLASLDIKTRDKIDMTSLLSGLIKCGVKIQAVPISENWYEVDSVQDLKLYNSLDNLEIR